MLMLPGGVKVYVASQPTDMRRSFNGLSLMVQEVLELNPTSGHLFVFVNKRADKLKVLYWDRNGFALWYKQLARGVFRLPRAQGCESYTITISDLSLLLEGIDLSDRGRQTAVHQAVIN